MIFSFSRASSPETCRAIPAPSIVTKDGQNPLMRLVDAALAAEFGLEWRDRNAVRLDRAVAAAFADRRVDEDAAIRIGIGSPLAAAALFGGTGLFVDDGRHALPVTQVPLDLVEFVPVMQADARGQGRAPLLRVVRHQNDRRHAFRPKLVQDVDRREVHFDRLATGHSDRIVEKQLERHVRLPSHRCADRKDAGM